MYKKQAITNVVNPIQLNNVSGLDNLSNFLKKEADKQIQKQKEIYTIKTQTTLVDSSKKLADTYNTDPVKLEEELNKNLDNILSNIDNEDIKINTYKQFLTIKQPLLTQAENNRIIQEDNDKKNSIYKHINSKIDTLSSFYDNMFNDTLGDNDIADYNINLQEVNELLQSKSIKNNPLFNQKDLENITKEDKRIKINSAVKHFNTLFENDPVAFKNRYNEWLNNPQTTQDRYSLTQEEYKSILSNANRLDKMLDTNTTTSEERSKTLINNKHINELEYRFNIAKDYEKDIIENTDFTGNKFLKDLDDYVEYARSEGLNKEEYDKYKSKIRSYYYAIADNILKENTNVKGGWFTSNNVLHDIVDVINDNISGYNEIEKTDLLGQAMTILSDNNINYGSKSTTEKEKAKKIMLNILADYYEIPKETPNKIEIIKQKKQERDKEETNKLLNNVVNMKIQQNIFDLNI